MGRNKKKMWQARVAVHYANALMWRRFAQAKDSELTNASIAVREYEREIHGLLDEAEAQRNVAYAQLDAIRELLDRSFPPEGLDSWYDATAIAIVNQVRALITLSD